MKHGIDGIAQTLLTGLTQAGFVIKEGKPGSQYLRRWLCLNKNKGVRFEIGTIASKSWPRVRIACKLRDQRGRMIQYKGPRWADNYCVDHINDLSLALVELLKLQGQPVTRPAISRKTELYPPLEFNAPYIIQGQTPWEQWVSLTHFYESCLVKGIATISPDLKVSVDGATEPDADCWFYITGPKSNGSGHPEIIVTEQNGKLVYYPVIRGKVTDDLQPEHVQVDFSSLTTLDRQLIEKAIQVYIAQFTSQ
jgi:hypothetical protein